MHKRSIATWGMALLLALAGHLATAAEFSSYVDGNGRFSMQLPSAWQRKPDSVLALSASPAASQTPAVKVVAAKFPAGMNLDKYIANSKAHWQKIWTVQEEKTITLDGQPAVRMMLDQVTGKKTGHLLKIFSAANGTVYVLTFYPDADDSAKSRDAFEQMIKSFKMLPVAAAK